MSVQGASIFLDSPNMGTWQTQLASLSRDDVRLVEGKTHQMEFSNNARQFLLQLFLLDRYVECGEMSAKEARQLRLLVDDSNILNIWDATAAQARPRGREVNIRYTSAQYRAKTYMHSFDGLSKRLKVVQTADYNRSGQEYQGKKKKKSVHKALVHYGAVGFLKAIGFTRDRLVGSGTTTVRWAVKKNGVETGEVKSRQVRTKLGYNYSAPIRSRRVVARAKSGPKSTTAGYYMGAKKPIAITVNTKSRIIQLAAAGTPGAPPVQMRAGFIPLNSFACPARPLADGEYFRKITYRTKEGKTISKWAIVKDAVGKCVRMQSGGLKQNALGSVAEKQQRQLQNIARARAANGRGGAGRVNPPPPPADNLGGFVPIVGGGRPLSTFEMNQLAAVEGQMGF